MDHDRFVTFSGATGKSTGSKNWVKGQILRENLLAMLPLLIVGVSLVELGDKVFKSFASTGNPMKGIPQRV